MLAVSIFDCKVVGPWKWVQIDLEICHDIEE